MEAGKTQSLRISWMKFRWNRWAVKSSYRKSTIKWIFLNQLKNDLREGFSVKAIWVFVIALCLLSRMSAAQASDSDYMVFSGKESRSFAQMIEELSKADVVVVGEQHDHKLGHSIELDVLKGLHTKKPSLALSLEMFERDVQLVVDEYLKGQINQSSFIAASRPWPNYKTD